MSTQINISVDDGGLLGRNQQDVAANRSGNLTRQSQSAAAERGKQERERRLKARGFDNQRRPSVTAPFRPERRLEEPAANRSVETVSMGWLCVGPNDWRTGDNFNQITAIEGTNLGRTLAISSTDATYWLQINGIPETQATGNFVPGKPTVYSAPFDTPYFTQRAWNNYTYETLPLGKGNYMLLIRYEMAYSRVRWGFVSGFPNIYAINMNEYSGISTHYQAFVVSKSDVRQLDSVPQQVKTYLDERVARAVPVTVGNYYTVVSVGPPPSWAYYGVSDWQPAGATSNFGLAQSFSSQLAANRAGNPNAYPYSAWYVGRMPFAIGPVQLGYGSPAVYSKFINYSEWVDVIPTQTNNYGTNAYDNWFLGLASAVPETKIKNALGSSRETDSTFYLNTFSIPVYAWKGVKPTGNEWLSGPAGNPPRPAITDTEYWKPYKVLSFSTEALPVPTLPSYPTDGGGISTPQRILLNVTDWGAPAYCRQQAVALGFTSADLTP